MRLALLMIEGRTNVFLRSLSRQLSTDSLISK